MLEDYQTIGTRDGGISFTKEGLDQLYKEGIAGLQWEFIRGTVVGGVTIGAITAAGVMSHKRLKKNKKED